MKYYGIKIDMQDRCVYKPVLFTYDLMQAMVIDMSVNINHSFLYQCGRGTCYIVCRSINTIDCIYDDMKYGRRTRWSVGKSYRFE